MRLPVRLIVTISLILGAVLIFGYGVYVKDTFYYFLALFFLALGLINAFPSFLSKKLNAKQGTSEADTTGEIFSSGDPAPAENKITQLSEIVSWKWLLSKESKPFLFVLAASTAGFTYLTIFKLSEIGRSENIFLAYYLSIKGLILGNTIVAAAITTITAIGFVLYWKKSKTARVYIFKPRSILGLLATIIVGVHISFFIAVLVVFLNIVTVTVGMDHFGKSFHTTWEAEMVANELRERKDIGDVVRIDENRGKQYFTLVGLIPGGAGSFFLVDLKSFVISNYHPTPKVVEDSRLYLIKDVLVVGKIEQNDLEKLAPIFGKILVTQYFGARIIKDEPHLSVIGRQEYLKYREEEINKVIAEIENDLKQVQAVVSSIANDIGYDRRMIGESQGGVADAQAQKNAEYNRCVNAGFWSYIGYSSYWVSLFSNNECRSQASRWDSIISQYQSNVNSWRAELSRDQKEYNEFIELRDLVASRKDIIEASKENTPQELGVFVPERDIKIALDSLNLEDSIDLFSVLTHEYLHYTSYVSEERRLPGFFEEGLTEYFSRRVIQKKFGVETNIGYPLVTRIIQEVANKVPEDELAEIYFTKDAARLESALDAAYGKEFYQQSRTYMSMISYVPPLEALKYANNLLVRMGGNEVTEEAMYSKLSEFK